MSIEKACRYLGFSKQAYFKARKNEQEKAMRMERATDFILYHVGNIRKRMKKIGAIKLYYLLNPKIKEAKIKIGRDRFINVLRENGLMIKRKRRRFVTTNSNHWMKKYDNLIEDLIPSRPEELYVADITYFETQEEGSVYGHLVTDAYSKKIMGFEVSLDLKAASSLLALKMSIDNRVNDCLLYTSPSPRDRG